MNRITIGAFILSLMIHIALLSIPFSINPSRERESMIVEIRSIREGPQSIEELTTKKVESPSIKPNAKFNPPIQEGESIPVEPIEPGPLEAEIETKSQEALPIVDKPLEAPSLSKVEEVQIQPTSPNIQEDFIHLIKSRIERVKYYPRLARERGFEGVVKVEFIITKEGGVYGLGVIDSSGYKILDEAAISTIRRALPFPRPPKELEEGLRLSVPIVYKLVEE